MRTQNQSMQKISLAVVIVATFTLPVFSQDGAILHFDFINDGEIQPWMGLRTPPTNLTLDDGLVLQKSDGHGVAEATGLDFTNTSIRAQVRLLEGQGIGLGVRGGGGVGSPVAIVESVSGESRVRIRRTLPLANVIDPVPIDLQVDIEDIVMQFDAVDQTLELRVWRPGDTIPMDATLSAPLPDGLRTNGTPWLTVLSDALTNSSEGVFREVWVSDAVIPEPSSVFLLCVGLFGFVAHIRR